MTSSSPKFNKGDVVTLLRYESGKVSTTLRDRVGQKFLVNEDGSICPYIANLDGTRAGVARDEFLELAFLDVGTTLRMTKDSGMLAEGETVQVEYVDRSDQYLTYRVRRVGDGYIGYIARDTFVVVSEPVKAEAPSVGLIEPPTPGVFFSIGDQIVLNEDVVADGLRAGQPYKIKKVDRSDSSLTYAIWKDADEDDYDWVYTSNVKGRVVAASAVPIAPAGPRFKVGDRLRVTGNTTIQHGCPIGEIVTVLKVNSPYYAASGERYDVDYLSQTVSVNDLELADAPTLAAADSPLLADLKRRITELNAVSERTQRQTTQLALLLDLLRVAGFEYRAVPVEPTYEFVSI